MEGKEWIGSIAASVAVDEELCVRIEQTTTKFSEAVERLLGPDIVLTSVLPVASSYGEFLHAADQDAYFYAIRTSPNLGHLLMHWPTRVVGLVRARMLGASEPFGLSVQVPLRDIESRLMAKVVGHFLDTFRAAWNDVLPFQMEVDSSLSCTQSAPLYPEGMLVSVAAVKFQIGAEMTTMKWLLPADWPQRIVVIRKGKKYASVEMKHPTAAEGETADKIVARLAETKMSATDLAGLNTGDIITTEKDVAEPIDVAIGGVVKFRANLGKAGEQKALHVVEEVKSPAENKDSPS